MSQSAWLADLLGDFRYALRGLSKNKTFSITVILTMALGIGANTAIFSLVNAMLLKALPVSDPAGLVLLTDPASGSFSQGISNGVRGALSWYEFQQLSTQTRLFTSLFAAQNGNDGLKYTLGKGPQEEGHGRFVTGNYFSVLGVPPVLGRTFSTADDQPGNAAPVVVLSHAFWQRRFQGAVDVLGKRIQVGKADLSVIGVMPPGFFGERVGESLDLWMPLQLEPQVQPSAGLLKMKDMSWLAVVGRLRPGVSRAPAQAELNVLFQQILRSEAPPKMSADETRSYLEQRLELRDGARGISPLRAQFSEPLLVLMLVVGVVLLIACANVANLLLARATGRTREIGIRLALGAAAGRLFRQLLAESLLYALLGGVVSLWLASWGSHALLALASPDRAPISLAAQIDPRVLAFTFGLSVLTGLIFGLAPAFAARRIDVAPTLQKSARGVMEGSGGRFSLRKILAVTQVALSLLLLVGAGLFVRTLRNLSETELGYRRDHLLVASLDLGSAGYKDARLLQVYKRLFEVLNNTPAVRAATFSVNGLFSGSEGGDLFSIEGFHAAPRQQPSARFDQVGPAYFHTVGIPLLAGRDFRTSDDEHAQKVVVVNQAFAKKFFAHTDPLGKWIRDEYPAGPRDRFIVVGVVADAKDHSLRDRVEPRVFTPILNGITPPADFTTLEIRTLQSASAAKTLLAKAIASIDPAIPISNLRTMDEQVERQLGTEKLIARLCTLFGALALLLASVGLYGVIAYSVGRRTAEMGIRLALGARASGLIWLILRETLLLVVAGIAIGIPVALVLSRLVGARLYAVQPYDPGTLLTAIAVLAFSSALAGLLPALRAARVDPLVALRWE